MKKQFLVLTAALIMTFSATFAQDSKQIPKTVVSELIQRFANAQDVQWQATDNYYKASFAVDGQPLRVFYSIDGDMIGVSRTIGIEQLPMALIREVKEKQAAYTVTDLFELLTDRGTEYYITYRGEKDTKTYKSSADYWTRY